MTKGRASDDHRSINTLSPAYDTAASTTPNAQNALGAYAGKYPDKPNLHQVYVLGDGHFLVNDENGDIAIGDPITTSSVEGEGMKMTAAGLSCGVAKEDITFTSTDAQLLVVQYGLRYFPN